MVRMNTIADARDVAFYKNNIYPLLLLEHTKLPVLLLENMVSLPVFIEQFPSLAIKYLHLDRDSVTCYQEKDFTVTKHSFVFKKGLPYYVAVLHFPFDMSRDFAGLARRMYIVFSKNLKRFHLYLEIMGTQVAKQGVLPYFDILYLSRENDGIMMYSLSEQSTVEEDEMAQHCAFWSYLIEKEDIKGKEKMAELKRNSV